MNISAAPRRVILDSVSILDEKEVAHKQYETCASVRAEFDDRTADLQVVLGSFVRRVEVGPDLILHPDWLPRADIVHTHLEAGEAATAAKEIFHSWVVKVRKSIPGFTAWNECPPWLQPETSKSCLRTKQ